MKIGVKIINKTVLATACLLLAAITLSAQAAEERWVTDRGEFTLRSGKSTSNKIVKMLKSGTRLELLKADADSGYSKVRLTDGTEGWVLSRYLLSSPPALVRLPELEKDVGRVAELSDERQRLQSEVRQLQSANSGLESELARIKKVSANAVKLDSDNTTLRKRLSESESVISELEEENRVLASKANREWFIVGAAVLVLGIVLGLIVPRLKPKKKSSW